MKTTKLLLLAQMILCSILITNSGCTKPPPAINKSPIANAGPDQTIMRPRANTRLSGDLSHDPDGRIVSYNWTIIAGPNAPDMKDDLQPYVKFVSNLEEAVYQFELMVVDNRGATARDTVKVTVLPDLLTGDPSRMQRFDSLLEASCAIRISNISSIVQDTANFKVFINRYYGGGVLAGPFFPPTGWFQIQPVQSSSYWYEIKDNELIIHVAANIVCGWDDAYYDVLIR